MRQLKKILDTPPSTCLIPVLNLSSLQIFPMIVNLNFLFVRVCILEQIDFKSIPNFPKWRIEWFCVLLLTCTKTVTIVLLLFIQSRIITFKICSVQNLHLANLCVEQNSWTLFFIGYISNIVIHNYNKSYSKFLMLDTLQQIPWCLIS